jgi:glycosyltransferase involved in cell wall biosynthesis
MASSALHLSIIIATYQRAASLDGVLASIAASSYPLERVHVVVADNADDPATRRVCETYASRLDLVYVVETAPGKNAALNTVLPHATGELFLFTDDDIEAPPEWLPETQAAAARWPCHAVFGGRVLPLWPSACPAHLRESRYLGMCFSVLDLAAEEGPSFDFTPFGPNVAIRRDVFDAGVRFDPRIGPRNSSYIMGSETELLRRLKRAGHAPVYMPRSVVRHTIRPEQLTDRWLLRRAFRHGRLMQVLSQERDGARQPAVRHLPNLLRQAAGVLAAGALQGRTARFNRAMELAMAWGAAYQAHQSLAAHAPAPAPAAPDVACSAPRP